MIGSCHTQKPYGITKWLVLVSLESQLQKSCITKDHARGKPLPQDGSLVRRLLAQIRLRSLSWLVR